MFFPIGDDQIKGGFFPYFSYAFIGLNVLVFLYQFSLGPEAGNQFVWDFGAIPNNVSHGNNYLTIFSSMFMHGGWMHLIGNMAFLWVFADNIESVIGSTFFFIFYILGGVAATMTHVMIDPSSTIPTVGASGAIAAVLGAYIVMFPSSKIKLLLVVFMRVFRWPAIAFLGIWIVQQLFSGFGSLGIDSNNGGTAWWAHIGGFAFGALVGLYLRKQYDTPGNYASGAMPSLPGRFS